MDSNFGGLWMARSIERELQLRRVERLARLDGPTRTLPARRSTAQGRAHLGSHLQAFVRALRASVRTRSAGRGRLA